MRRQKTTDYHVTVQISFSAAALHHASVMLDWHETIFASMLSSSRHLHNKQPLNMQSESDPWFTLAGISMNAHDLHCNAMRWEVPCYVCVSAHRSGSVTRNPPPNCEEKRTQPFDPPNWQICGASAELSERSGRNGDSSNQASFTLRAGTLIFHREAFSHKSNESLIPRPAVPNITLQCRVNKAPGIFFFFFHLPKKVFSPFFATLALVACVWMAKVKKKKKKIKISPFPHFLCAWRHDS